MHHLNLNDEVRTPYLKFNVPILVNWRCPYAFHLCHKHCFLRSNSESSRLQLVCQCEIFIIFVIIISVLPACSACGLLLFIVIILLYISHSGYREFKGQVLNSSDLASLVGGLRSNNLLHYSHMLTGECTRRQTTALWRTIILLLGYVGSKSFLEHVAEVVKELKDINRKLIYGEQNGNPMCVCVCGAISIGDWLCLLFNTAVCDPVLGDNGQLVRWWRHCCMHVCAKQAFLYTQYVPAELPPVYKEKLLPIANIITPNQFEAEWVYHLIKYTVLVYVCAWCCLPPGGCCLVWRSNLKMMLCRSVAFLLKSQICYPYSVI